jgi:hypothetical protein
VEIGPKGENEKVSAEMEFVKIDAWVRRFGRLNPTGRLNRLILGPRRFGQAALTGALTGSEMTGALLHELGRLVVAGHLKMNGSGICSRGHFRKYYCKNWSNLNKYTTHKENRCKL